VLGLTINGYDIHESRDYEPHPPRVKEIISSTEHCECRKRQSRSCHQNCAIDVARMIAAQDERRNRKVLPPGYLQWAITEEKHPAESLKHGAPTLRRQEHTFRCDFASHKTYGGASLAFSDRARIVSGQTD
jgi:hypothetical protein